MDNAQDLQKSVKNARNKIITIPRLLRILLLLAFDLASVWFVTRLVGLGYYPLVVLFAVIVLGVNFIIIRKQAYPLRWMLVGLVLMTLFTIYPIVFTVWVAFTNYGEGHLITQEQAVDQILNVKYLPEEGKSYKWTAFKNEAGDYALWLIDPEGAAFLAFEGEPIFPGVVGENGIGELDSKGIPATIEGYKRLNAFQAATDTNITNVLFGESGKTIQIRTPSEAAELVPLYLYDSTEDSMTNQQTGMVYKNLRGTYTSSTGDNIKPGFMVSIGANNFRDFFISPALRGPLVRLVLWNFSFAILSLLLNFGLGLLIAIMYNDRSFPLKKLIRSLLIIPYTIPALITVIIWRGMLNPELGVVTRIFEAILGWAPPFMTDQWWAKVAILIINMWLSYPYFMLICSGSLQSIPQDIYEAAVVDGASPWQKFWKITLPLLLVSVGPLLVASFTFNFNNFNLIYLFNAGGPPMAGTPTPAGHTDILISYVYNLAFAGSRGVNYGFASAITIIIFVIVGIITLFQFRFTNMWEEVSENV